MTDQVLVQVQVSLVPGGDAERAAAGIAGAVEALDDVQTVVGYGHAPTTADYRVVGLDAEGQPIDVIYSARDSVDAAEQAQGEGVQVVLAEPVFPSTERDVPSADPNPPPSTDTSAVPEGTVLEGQTSFDDPPPDPEEQAAIAAAESEGLPVPSEEVNP